MSLIALPVACRIDGKAMDGITSLLPDLQGGPLGLRLGPEKLLNGGFDTDTVWTKGGGWTISAGQAAVLTPGVTSSLSQPTGIANGTRYLMLINVTTMPSAAIVVRAYAGASVVFAFGATITSAGTYARIVTAIGIGDTFVVDGSANASASVDSVSLREVL